uniref:Uncharacterized protein n=1 Tax=Cryptotermes secundus lispivirus 1 TaxID=3133545 RepID=A0AAT9JH35_9MONO
MKKATQQLGKSIECNIILIIIQQMPSIRSTITLEWQHHKNTQINCLDPITKAKIHSEPLPTAHIHHQHKIAFPEPSLYQFEIHWYTDLHMLVISTPTGIKSIYHDQTY